MPHCPFSRKIALSYKEIATEICACDRVGGFVATPRIAFRGRRRMRLKTKTWMGPSSEIDEAASRRSQCVHFRRTPRSRLMGNANGVFFFGNRLGRFAAAPLTPFAWEIAIALTEKRDRNLRFWQASRLPFESAQSSFAECSDRD